MNFTLNVVSSLSFSIGGLCLLVCWNLISIIFIIVCCTAAIGVYAYAYFYRCLSFLLFCLYFITVLSRHKSAFLARKYS